MPTPVKPAVDGRRLGGRDAARVAGNASHPTFVEQLRARGVPVFDVLDELRAARAEQPRPLYLATDTHWRPETVELVAGRLAAFIERRVVFADGRTTVRRTAAQPVTNHGDTARLLGPARPRTAYPPETVDVRRIVFDAAGNQRSERRAEILLLGDSFSNVFSLAAMGWGAAAGLAEQLAFALQRPVDRLARNDDGAYGSRALLAAVPRAEVEHRLDLDTLMSGEASEPSRWPAPFADRGAGSPDLVDVGPGHRVRAWPGPLLEALAR